MAEYTEDCCFNDIRERCTGRGCPCGCHVAVAVVQIDRSEWINELEARVAMLPGMRDSDEARDTALDVCRDDVPRLLAEVRRWEAFDFERDNPARLVEHVLALMVERDTWRRRAEASEAVVSALTSESPS